MEFAERLRELRKEKGMSMEDVGKYIGVGRSNIFKYEHGMITNVPPEKTEMLAELFGVSRSYLLGWSDQRNGSDDQDLVPGIAIPDNYSFIKAYEVMPYQDRVALTDIFKRAFEKLAEKEHDEELK